MGVDVGENYLQCGPASQPKGAVEMGKMISAKHGFTLPARERRGEVFTLILVAVSVMLGSLLAGASIGPYVLALWLVLQ